jgi:hypothetical protein
MIDVTKVSATVAAVGAVGGGALTLDNLHVPSSWAESHEADHRVRTIFELADRSFEAGAPDWLCDAIEQEFIMLCTDAPDHYLCEDPEAKKDIMEGAGCE